MADECWVVWLPENEDYIAGPCWVAESEIRAWEYAWEVDSGLDQPLDVWRKVREADGWRCVRMVSASEAEAHGMDKLLLWIESRGGESWLRCASDVAHAIQMIRRDEATREKKHG